MHRLKAEYAGRIVVRSVHPRSGRSQKIAGQYVAAFTPTFVFVRHDGSIQNIFLGFVDEADLRDELEALLDAKGT